MPWFTVPGVEQDVVLHTRIHILRNLHGTPFPSRLEADAAVELIDRVGGVLSDNGFHKIDFSDVSRASAYAYAEQQYVTPDFVRKSVPHALYLNEPCNLSVSLCDDDHIHIRGLMPGFSLRDAFNSAYKIEGLLDTHFDFAFDTKLGYLTQRPDYTGCGMGMSVLLFLPALSLCGRIPALTQHLHQVGLLLSPIGIETDHAIGYLYRITIRSLPAADEQAISAHVERAVRQIIECERSRRDNLPADLLEHLTDQVSRAEGILKSAHLLSLNEFIRLSSYVRLGVALGWVGDIRIESLNSLLMEAMPATLTTAAEAPPHNRAEQDRLRAALTRERLSV